MMDKKQIEQFSEYGQPYWFPDTKGTPYIDIEPYFLLREGINKEHLSIYIGGGERDHETGTFTTFFQKPTFILS